MSDGSDPVTPPQDTGAPDSAETDPAALSSAEDLDEDRLRVDPLEEGVEPPERWSEATSYGMTPAEQREGESLEQRVRQERPDVEQPSVPDRPVGDTPPADLDDTVDYLTETTEPVPPYDEPIEPDTETARRGQSADEPGGSVADSVREPESEPE
ncbi:hypothetical protein SacmaDRAFT_1733 [Saccharomonospora marina XMU15]|uniref:DUF5709 domain-containing protein n=1 Tax=Saccharomonospora marina XMU15 TaxID=882083 RepID=H5X4J9_9PSEU|nr:hypothetical protein [Saccharomonospora marina]EHR50003.1 hypothetical protein SacmaDRAFT_1733 [Saccharomonospora marina XMU15]